MFRHIAHGSLEAGISSNAEVPPLAPGAIARDVPAGNEDVLVAMTGEIAADEVDCNRTIPHALEALGAHFHMPKCLGGISKGNEPPVAVYGHTEADMVGAVLLRRLSPVWS